MLHYADACVEDLRTESAGHHMRGIYDFGSLVYTL